MTDKKLNIIIGLLSATLLTSLIIKLTDVPGGMILSGLFLGGMIIIGILIGCLIATGILKLLLKKTSFISIYSITTAICFTVFHYNLYSPKLTITVPNGYVGKVEFLIKSGQNSVNT